MNAALNGQTILIAHDDAEHAAAIERAVRVAGARTLIPAPSVAEAIERLHEDEPGALVFSATLPGDTRVLIDAASVCGTRIVILYPPESQPGFPFDDYRCVVAPYSDAELLQALAETLSATRGCSHWSARPNFRGSHVGRSEAAG